AQQGQQYAGEAPAYMRPTYTFARAVEEARMEGSLHEPHPPPQHQIQSEEHLAQEAQARAARFDRRSRMLKAQTARVSAGHTLQRKRELEERQQADKERRVNAHRIARGQA